LCHPIFYYLLQSDQQGIDLKHRLDSMTRDNLTDTVEIPNVGKFSKDEIDYYIQKFFFLKSNGYFSSVDQQTRLSGEIDAGFIEKILANNSQVIFEVTERCNISCEYCCYGKFYNQGDHRVNKDLDIAAAIRLIDYLHAFWNSPMNRSQDREIYINFFGGEPLLGFPFIKAVIDHIKQLPLLHNYFVFSITTNGVLLHNYMDYLQQNDVELWISLDGSEQNNAYRMLHYGKPSFDIIMENVKTIRKKYPAYFKERVNFLATLHNKNSFSEIYRFFKTRFDKIPLIGPLNATGIKESEKKNFWKTYSNLNQSLHESEDYSLIEKDMFLSLPTVQDVIVFLHRYSDFFFNNYRALLFDDIEQIRTPSDTCLPFLEKLFVTASGKILPCEKIAHQFELGSVTADSLELDFEKIADKYNRYFNRIRKQCNQCWNADICAQCLFFIPGIDGDNPRCNGFMTGKDFEKYISSFVDYFENKPWMYPRFLKEVTFE